MKSRFDKTLALWVDVEVQIAKMNFPRSHRRTLLRSVLLEFEERGFASRCLRLNGKIGWCATPKMHEYLRDAELDATDDLDRNN